MPEDSKLKQYLVAFLAAYAAKNGWLSKVSKWIWAISCSKVLKGIIIIFKSKYRICICFRKNIRKIAILGRKQQFGSWFEDKSICSNDSYV